PRQKAHNFAELKVMRRKSVTLQLIGISLITLLIAGLAGCSVNLGGSSSGGGPKLDQIAVTPSGTGLPVGATEQFVATGTYSNGSQKNISSTVTWNSTPTGLITIDST